jgi:GNAT superfamily N-acetyltransferase
MNDDPAYFRLATRDDLAAIVRMLADDPLGSARERATDPLPPAYRDAFEAIDRDPNQELMVAVRDDQVVGTLQLTCIPGISRQGMWRGLIEGVRVDASVRGMGVGRQMVEWAIARARERGCAMVQLTSDKSRRDAIRFYESLGFEATHEGMKRLVSDGHNT